MSDVISNATLLARFDRLGALADRCAAKRKVEADLAQHFQERAVHLDVLLMPSHVEWQIRNDAAARALYWDARRLAFLNAASSIPWRWDDDDNIPDEGVPQ